MNRKAASADQTATAKNHHGTIAPFNRRPGDNSLHPSYFILLPSDKYHQLSLLITSYHPN
jgi:hypothetical protein